MKRFLIRALAGVGAAALLWIVVMSIVVVRFSRKPTVPAEVILETEFHRGLEEREDSSFLEALGAQPPTVRQLLEALERGGDDPRVVALVSDLSEVNAGLAQLQEIRDAIIAFRAKGKRAIAYADTFGELGAANGAYYLATAYDEIHLQPSGSVGLTGLAVEIPFARETLERIGVTPRFFKRHEYKTAPETLMEKGLTPANRESTEAWLDSQFRQIVRGVAEARKLPEAEVTALVQNAPLPARQALEKKLVDSLSYRDEVYSRAREGKGAKAKTLYLSAYRSRAGALGADASDKIALIYGTGGVQRGRADEESFAGDAAMYSQEVVAAFRAAVRDPKVKAILFRVDSPGGSYVASDTIRRAVAMAKQEGKPVIVSMGNVAASGGYFVAMDADKVVAQPGTLTGSIGVYAGKLVTSELWGKLGVNWETLARGENATLLSSDADFTPAQQAKVEAWLDEVYEDFTTKAAQGRGLAPDKLREAAKGRVWTGEDAQRLGLVDALGGMRKALELAREAAKLPPDAKVRVQVFPEEKPPLQQLAEFLSGRQNESSEEEVRTRKVMARAPLVRGVGALVREVVLGREPEPLDSEVREIRW